MLALPVLDILDIYTVDEADGGELETLNDPEAEIGTEEFAPEEESCRLFGISTLHQRKPGQRFSSDTHHFAKGPRRVFQFAPKDLAANYTLGRSLSATHFRQIRNP